MIDWKKRARKDQTRISDRRTWDSKCGQYRVQEYVPRLIGMDTIYYSISLTDGILWNNHRTRKAAERRCENHQKGAE